MPAAPDHIDTAVFYLFRGADEDSYAKAHRFLKSYLQYDAGMPHDLFIIYKGFAGAAELEDATRLTSSVEHNRMFFPDDGFDIEAYYRASIRVGHKFVFFLNTSSIIDGSAWLLKLHSNLNRPGIGLVGATASYESAVGGAYQFPNLHIRSNAFMLLRTDFLATRRSGSLVTKMDAYELEHGEDSLTAQCLKRRQTPLVVGKNGRGYPPYLWPVSGTFRQGGQHNLLIRDGQTDTFANAPHPFKRQLFNLAWHDGAMIEGLKIWNPRGDAVAAHGEQS